MLEYYERLAHSIHIESFRNLPVKSSSNIEAVKFAHSLQKKLQNHFVPTPFSWDFQTCLQTITWFWSFIPIFQIAHFFKLCMHTTCCYLKNFTHKRKSNSQMEFELLQPLVDINVAKLLSRQKLPNGAKKMSGHLWGKIGFQVLLTLWSRKFDKVTDDNFFFSVVSACRYLLVLPHQFLPLILLE